MSQSEEVSFATQDGGVVFADVYGAGERGVVLAHGMRFDKGSWSVQAGELAEAGYRVLAIDFRGYGNSRGGPESDSPREEMYLDVLAATDYLRAHGATSVAVIGASMGGFASANAVVKSERIAMDRLVLLAHAPVENPELITGPKFFITAQEDEIAGMVVDQYVKAPEPKELLFLEGSAHAQFLFATDQSMRLMEAILEFLGRANTP